jgi:hypothetical protein
MTEEDDASAVTRIRIAEDNAINRGTLGRRLARRGFDIPNAAETRV